MEAVQGKHVSKKISVGLIPLFALVVTAFGFGFATAETLLVGPKMVVALLLTMLGFGTVIVAIVFGTREING
jgi:hypothetical protein